jgi:hypothetical protein
MMMSANNIAKKRSLSSGKRGRFAGLGYFKYVNTVRRQVEVDPFGFEHGALADVDCGPEKITKLQHVTLNRIERKLGVTLPGVRRIVDHNQTGAMNRVLPPGDQKIVPCMVVMPAWPQIEDLPFTLPEDGVSYDLEELSIEGAGAGIDHFFRPADKLYGQFHRTPFELPIM